MSSSSSWFPSQPTNLDWHAFFKQETLPPRVRQHVIGVYLALVFGLIGVAAGVYAHLLYGLSGLLSNLGSIGMIVWLGLDRDKSNYNKRLAILAAAGFFMGVSIAPLIQYALFKHPNLIVSAFVCTTAIFICFSMMAWLSPRRDLLWMGGLLSSGLSVLVLLGLLNLVFRSPLLFSVELYAGLAIFAFYVAYDTQVIMMRAEESNDVIWHALMLLIDFVAIFVRVLIILLRAQSSKERSKKSTRRVD